MILRDNNTVRKIFRLFLYCFAIIGFLFAGVFFAMQFNLLNVKGSVSQRNSYFNIPPTTPIKNSDNNNLEIICKINVLSKYAPSTSVNIYKTLTQGGDESLLAQMISLASKRFENNNIFQKQIENCKNSSTETLDLPISSFPWADSDEWNMMKGVFTRDQEIIKRAASVAKISPRIILGGVMGEQLRFFTNSRESFKSYFEPLKILASLSKFSFGIAGLKPQTVALIDAHLKDPSSVFYLGPEMEHVADYAPNADIESEIMDRITNAKDPYYSYLYVGLYMKQVIAQWAKAGYDISNRPEIIATLYNLGFNRSIPKANAGAGGANIKVSGVDYTFGDLAYEFYYSGELADIFPIVNK